MPGRIEDYAMVGDLQTAALVGNFPQAFTHLALVNCALALSNRGGNRATRE